MKKDDKQGKTEQATEKSTLDKKSEHSLSEAERIALATDTSESEAKQRNQTEDRLPDLSEPVEPSASAQEQSDENASDVQDPEDTEQDEVTEENINELEVAAVGAAVSEGTVQGLPELPYDGSIAFVHSLERNLDISSTNINHKDFFIPDPLQPNFFPVAPLIILDPVFEYSLRSSRDSDCFSGELAFATAFVDDNGGYDSEYDEYDEYDKCNDCDVEFPTIVMTNLYKEGASHGPDGPGAIGLLLDVRQGITIDDIIANADAIGFTDPGGISYFYPTPFQQETTLYIDPAGFQVLTTPEGNTLTLYTSAVDGFEPGDIVYELRNNTLHIPGMPGLEIIDGDPIDCLPYDVQIFMDPFLYFISDSNFDVATNYIMAQIVDDEPYAGIHYNFIDEADIMTIGTNQTDSVPTVNGYIVDDFRSGFGADGGIVSNVTIINGTTVVDPENNLLQSPRKKVTF